MTDSAFEHASRDASTPSEAVVYAIAEQTDQDPAVLPPLYEAVDPDALDTLVLGGRWGA